MKISEEKNAKKFVGQVIANTGDMITVKFLKKVPAFDKYVKFDKKMLKINVTAVTKSP